MRYLAMLDFSHTWLPYIYLYGVGGIAFIVGMILILKTSALNLTQLKHRKWLVVLLFGFMYYAGIHGALIIAALKG